MPITRADLVRMAQDAGADRVAGTVVFPSEDAVVTFARAVRSFAANDAPTVPDADADAYIDEQGKVQELLQNGANTVVRALARRVKLLAGG